MEVDIRVWSAVTGVLVTLSFLLGWLGWMKRDQEVETLFSHRIMNVTHVVSGKRSWLLFREQLIADATAIGQPERAGVWMRTTLIVCGLPFVLAVLFQEPLFILFIPLVFFLPLVYARELRKLYFRNLERQTRQAEILVAFLLRSGAQIGDALQTLEQHMKSPFRERIAEVNTMKRYATIPGALEALAQSTGVSQLSDFAVLIGESERYGTPVAQAVMRSLALETKLRDSRAVKRYGEVQLQLSMYATFLIAFPGFGFVLYALLSYALSLFQGLAF